MGRFPLLLSLVFITIHLNIAHPYITKSDFAPGLGLLQDLGLDDLPEASKINISQSEYIEKMGNYLKQLPQSDINSPNLITFDAELSIDYERRRPLTKVKFPTIKENPSVRVEQSEVRMLFPRWIKDKAVRVSVYQILEGGGRRLVDTKTAYLSAHGPKWCEFDVTSATTGWLGGESNLGLEVECMGCRDRFLAPAQVALSALVRIRAPARNRRAAHAKYYDGETEECSADVKRRCCRHSMKVTFKALKVPQIRSIVQPKTYEAGFCKGRCPPNFNIATNHSRIQSLVHRLDRNAVPKVCCTPSKLAPLDILRVDPYDFTKLVVERWENMKVLECACS